MNTTLTRAIEQLREARETLGRALDDSTLSVPELALIRNIYLDVHSSSLSLAFINSSAPV